MADSIDLMARKVLMSAHLYYDLDSAILWDGEADQLALEVSKRWDELSPTMQYMLGGDQEAIRHSTCHCLVSRATINGARSWHSHMIGWEPEKLSVFRGDTFETEPGKWLLLQKIGS